MSRLFRRWAHAGLWSMMLKFVAKERPGLEAIQYWVCRAFRRAWRIQGLAGLRLARRLGLDSALRAPSWMLPDPDLSEYFHTVLLPRHQATLFDQPLPIIQAHIALWKRLYGLMLGRRSIPRWMAPP
jgi:hypothetical protein